MTDGYVRGWRAIAAVVGFRWRECMEMARRKRRPLPVLVRGDSAAPGRARKPPIAVRTELVAWAEYERATPRRGHRRSAGDSLTISVTPDTARAIELAAHRSGTPRIDTVERVLNAAMDRAGRDPSALAGVEVRHVSVSARTADAMRAFTRGKKVTVREIADSLINEALDKAGAP